MPCYGSTYCYFCGVVCFMDRINRHELAVVPSLRVADYAWTCDVVAMDEYGVYDTEESSLIGRVYVRIPYVLSEHEYKYGRGYEGYVGMNSGDENFILHRRCYNILRKVHYKPYEPKWLKYTLGEDQYKFLCMYEALCKAIKPITEIDKYTNRDYYYYCVKIGKNETLISEEIHKCRIDPQSVNDFKKLAAGGELWLYNDPKTCPKQQERFVRLINGMFGTSYTSLITI